MWVARFNGCSFPSERCREYGTGCRGWTPHGAFYATGLYNYKGKMVQFGLYIFYHNEKKLLKNIYYLMWVGLHPAAGTVYKQHSSAHALCHPAPQAEPSPDWRPPPQWMQMSGDRTSPLWQGSRAKKVHSVMIFKGETKLLCITGPQ